MSDSLKIWGTDYTGVKGFKAKDSSNNQYAYLRPQGTKSIIENGTGIDVSEFSTVDVAVPAGIISHNLPSAYQEVRYITGQESGAAIDTGIQPDETTYAELKVAPLAVTGDVLLGTKGANDSSDWRLFNYSSTVYWDVWSSRTYGTSFVVNTIRELRVENFKVTDLETGVILTSGTTVSDFDVPYDIFINGGSPTMTTQATWYYVTIYKGGTKVREYIPCYRKSDDVVGMYDLVSSTFFASAGSGAFTAGPDVQGGGGSSNDFIITVSQNTQTEEWEPDCTWAEFLAAYNGEKNIIFQTDDSTQSIAWEIYNDPEFALTVGYGVQTFVEVSVGESDKDYRLDEDTYYWNAEEFAHTGTYPYWDTTPADATASDLADGLIAYGSNGRIIGTYTPSSPTLQTKTKNYTPTESQQTEAVTADSGYDGLATVNVTIGAISSSYVGSGITRRSSSDLTISGNTVSAPAGYYESSASKSVASGMEGTPIAVKSTVSNHSISVTPSVTNSAGYISGGTHTGTAVTVTASELASGSKSIFDNGSGIDVVGYSTVDVTVPNAFTISDVSNTSGTTAQITAGTGGGGGATQHEIHLEFSDSTDTDIDVYYDDALIDTMITSYEPSTWTYSNKTVMLAQLDNVTWYDKQSIPIGVQLVDYTQVMTDTAIDSNGDAEATQWFYASDYIHAEAGMSYSYRASYWYYIAFYNESKTCLGAFTPYQGGGAQDPNDTNTGYGPINAQNVPAGTKYIRLSGTGADSDHMSLIRTA